MKIQKYRAIEVIGGEEIEGFVYVEADFPERTFIIDKKNRALEYPGTYGDCVEIDEVIHESLEEI